jgi:hypothetical protein
LKEKDSEDEAILKMVGCFNLKASKQETPDFLAG